MAMVAWRLLAVAALALAAPAAEASPLDDTARFLAGKGGTGALATKAQAEAYTTYAAQLRSSWKQFAQPNLTRMTSWWRDHAPARVPSTVFYPFSGPDLANALALFPDAEAYVMFGLEATGSIPDLANLDDPELAAGLHQLAGSLSTVLQVNYFFTRAMEKQLGKGAFNSVASLLVVFLALADCEVTGATEISLQRGELVRRRVEGAVPGIELTFRRTGGSLQTIRYFTIDVGDATLAKSGFASYVERLPRVATMIKSASYLMHGPRFERIRALILRRSELIVQDDSGIPLRWLPRETWRLRFHGRYEAPTPEFDKYLQKDLRIELQRNSTGKLPFSYGYAFKRGESNLMTAERK